MDLNLPRSGLVQHQDAEDGSKWCRLTQISLPASDLGVGQRIRAALPADIVSMGGNGRLIKSPNMGRPGHASEGDRSTAHGCAWITAPLCMQTHGQ